MKNQHISLTLPPMQLNTVIFDMDGLLIDSEPCWQQAGTETLRQFNVTLSPIQYHHTTGLRTPEWLDYWFGYFGIDKQSDSRRRRRLHANVFEKIRLKPNRCPASMRCSTSSNQNSFQIGLATSSPLTSQRS
jgi:beta-phosphoglucomutase-like phosphatase (HAD superfamily)